MENKKIKNKKLFGLIGIMLILILGTVYAGTMTRSLPTSVSPGQTFTLTYTVSEVSGLYGASVIDAVSGGCTPTGEHKFVLADDAQYTTTKSFTYTAPSSGSCTFSGDYQFGTEAIKTFPQQTITVSSSNQTNTTIVCAVNQTKCESTTYFTCLNNAWVNKGLVSGKCGYGTSCTANSSCKKDTCTTTVCSDSCGNSYTGTKECPKDIVPFLSTVIFKIGDFDVTWGIIIGAFVAFIILINFIPSR
jgi:hypothetical protein